MLTPLTPAERSRVEDLFPLLYWVAHGAKGHVADVHTLGEFEDRLQDGFFGVVRAVRHYKPGGATLKSYAVVCIRGAIIDGHRSRERSRRRTKVQVLPLEYENADERKIVIDPDPTPEGILMEDGVQEVYRKVSRLTPREQEIAWSLMDGKTLREVGEEQGLSESGVCRARQKMAAKVCGGR